MGTTSRGPSSRTRLGRRAAADRRPVADGRQEDVDLADRRPLLGAEERGLPEVAEVADAEAPEREPEERVRAAGRARDVVVLARDRDDLADQGVSNVPAVEQDHERLALDRLDAPVVGVLVRDEEDVPPGRPRSAGSRTAGRASRARSRLSPNGSTTTDRSPRSRNADWPNQRISTTGSSQRARRPGRGRP